MQATTQPDRTFTRQERDEMSRAFSRGGHASAYESTDIADHDTDGMAAHERAAFVLGFFASLTLDEIGSDREIFDECYHSDAGRYVVAVAHYCDDRADEYAGAE